MRSRYSAFAMGLIDYLMVTLHDKHPDRASTPDVLRESLRATCRAYRFTGLTVEGHEEGAERPTVTFVAKLFERGADRSFRERSTFERSADGLRYLSGEMLAL